MKKIFFSFVLMIMGLCVVNAEGYSIELDYTIGSSGSSLKMYLEGIDIQTAIDNNYSYYIKFANEGDPKPELTGNPYDSSEGIGTSYDKYFHVNLYKDDDTNTYYSSIPVKYDWYMLKGYTEAYVVECKTYTTCELKNEKITIDKPALPQLGQKYQNFLFGDKNEAYTGLSIFPHFPYFGETGSHEINVKIGLINDDNLLRKLAKNEVNALNELLEYAKNNDGKNFKTNDGDSNKVDINGFDIINGAYYYMYTYYTNSDGLYRNLDDITVVMGEHDMLVNDVEWNFEESLWDKYVEKFKNTEFIKTLEEEYTIQILSTENTLKINMSDDTNTWAINFNYNNGILSLVPSEVEGHELVEIAWVYNSIMALADLKGYELEDLQEWLDDNESLTIEKDGIEYSTEDYEYESDGVTLKSKKFKSFDLSIEKGLNYFNKLAEDKLAESQNKKNPNTGIYFKYGVLGLIVIIGMIAFVFVKKQNKFPRHN